MKPALAAKLSFLSLCSVLFTALTACDGDAKKQLDMATVQVAAKITAWNVPDEVAKGFHQLPIEARQLADGIFQATGVANTQMIVTTEGNVVFDTGLNTESVKQRKLLRRISDAQVAYVVLSHSHADHVGGTRFWLESKSQLITSSTFAEKQHYLTELQPFYWQRERELKPWLPAKPPKMKALAYGGLEPDILLNNDFAFELGDTRFEVLITPGAEDTDSISLWMPDRKILFSGDFFGELWPQFPAVFTMRGEIMPSPMAYIASLNKLIALEPEMIIPSHHDPIEGKERILTGMVKMRDALQFVHDAVLAGMNNGKTIGELMQSIRLPKELALTEERGKVAWAVKSIWHYYAGWFGFQSAAELYPVPKNEVYQDLAQMAGIGELVAKANNYIDTDKPVQALHLMDIALSNEPEHTQALATRLAALTLLQALSETNHRNLYEEQLLSTRIAAVKKALGEE
jgi:alkyl sulfatase BDS1-like metallo-beta-lactamase superfamily hydrolase